MKHFRRSDEHHLIQIRRQRFRRPERHQERDVPADATPNGQVRSF